MTEKALWRYVSRGMRGRWHAQRHEDRYARGVPDVSFAVNGSSGWLELKHRGSWGSATYVNLGLTMEQATWLKERGRHGGGGCYVLARVADDFLLLPHDFARELAGGMHVHTLRRACTGFWSRRIRWDEFTNCLANGWHSNHHGDEPS